jgi:hypothetical protein
MAVFIQAAQTMYQNCIFIFGEIPKEKKKQTSYCNIKTRSLCGEIEHNIIAFPKNEKYEKNQEICISIFQTRKKKRTFFFIWWDTHLCW